MRRRDDRHHTGTRHRGTATARAHIGTGALALLVALIGPGAPVASAATPPTSGVHAFMTLYGYVDNSPSGTAIAHPCLHSGAGGTGTFNDPVTFATDVSELPWCATIYVPYMERYFIHEDECSECDADWTNSHRYRFDMWAGGDAASLHDPARRALLACEDTWTRANSIGDPANPTVLIDPPPGLPVTTDPVFSAPTGCWHPITVANPGSQTTTLPAGPVRLPIRAADSSPGQRLRYSASGLPVGLSIGAASGTVSGTPTTRQHARVQVTAADAFTSVTITFRWTVRPPPRVRHGPSATSAA